MPHLLIEYSANLEDALDIGALVQAAHEAALATGVVARDALRTRAARREHVRVADGDPSHGFVAVVLRLAPGRSDEELQRLLDAVVEVVDAEAVAMADRHAVAVSVEIQEIDPTRRVNRNHVRDHLLAVSTGKTGQNCPVLPVENPSGRGEGG